jgi:hypothetical protein
MMSDDLAFERRNFLRDLDIGEVSAAPFAADAQGAAQPVFVASQEQAVVVGSEVVSFTAEVEPEFRQAISDSALVAQLGANAKVDPKLDPVAWFDSYFAILGVLGWATQACWARSTVSPACRAARSSRACWASPGHGGSTSPTTGRAFARSSPGRS